MFANDFHQKDPAKSFFKIHEGIFDESGVQNLHIEHRRMFDVRTLPSAGKEILKTLRTNLIDTDADAEMCVRASQKPESQATANHPAPGDPLHQVCISWAPSLRVD